MLLVGLLRAGLAAVAAFFLALAAGDASVASGVLLDGAGGTTAQFLFVGEDGLAEHLRCDAVDDGFVFRVDGLPVLPVVEGLPRHEAIAHDAVAEGVVGRGVGFDGFDEIFHFD